MTELQYRKNASTRTSLLVSCFAWSYESHSDVSFSCARDGGEMRLWMQAVQKGHQLPASEKKKELKPLARVLKVSIMNT